MLDGLVDFIIDIPEKREIVILQITDTQPVDPGQKRFPGRIQANEPLTESSRYDTIYRYIDDGIARSHPDLIIVTGDIVYGEFDDGGDNLISFINFMESKNIPWAPVFGNHDNESKKGVGWQCEQFAKADHCLFGRGSVTGNGNYTIGVRCGGELVRVVYMMDSNGCGQAYKYTWYCDNYPDYNSGEKVRTEPGFGDDQIEWLVGSAAHIDSVSGRKVPKFACFHIPVDIGEYVAAKGYQSDCDPGNAECFEIGKTVEAKDGDFGSKGEMLCGFRREGIMDVFKKAGFDGFFVGHCHKNDLSVMCDGIRVTYGLKTGTHDYHDKVGSTQIAVSPDGKTFSVKHLYY